MDDNWIGLDGHSTPERLETDESIDEGSDSDAGEAAGLNDDPAFSESSEECNALSSDDEELNGDPDEDDTPWATLPDTREPTQDNHANGVGIQLFSIILVTLTACAIHYSYSLAEVTTRLDKRIEDLGASVDGTADVLRLFYEFVQCDRNGTRR